MKTGEDSAPTKEVLPAEPGAGSEDHRETQAGVPGKVCPESPGQEAASPAHTQTRPPGSARKRAREGGSIPTERGPPRGGPWPWTQPWAPCRALSLARVPWSPERGLGVRQSVWWRLWAAVGLPGTPGPPRARGLAFCSPTQPGNSVLGLGAGIRCDIRQARGF